MRDGDVAVLGPVLADPTRRTDCGHAKEWQAWLHYLGDVVVDERCGECYRLLRCWTCGERILVRPVERSLVGKAAGFPLWLRGLALLDDLTSAVYDPDYRVAESLASRRWAWGLGALELEVSFRAGAAAVGLALDHDLPDPTYKPPFTRP